MDSFKRRIKALFQALIGGFMVFCTVLTVLSATSYLINKPARHNAKQTVYKVTAWEVTV